MGDYSNDDVLRQDTFNFVENVSSFPHISMEKPEISQIEVKAASMQTCLPKYMKEKVNSYLLPLC